MTRRLYSVPLPERGSDQTTDSIRQQLAERGVLNSDQRAVEQIAPGEKSHRLTGRIDYGETLSPKVGRELASLGESAFGAVPLFGDATGAGGETTVLQPGYYEVRDGAASPAFEGFRSLWSYDLTLSKVGTRQSHLRAVETTVQDAQNPFASGSSPLIGIDANATEVAWFSVADGLAPAVSTTTVTTEFADVDLFAPRVAPFDDPTLVYTLPFEREGRADVVVWDDRDRTRTETISGVDVRPWAHVFDTAWEREGSFVISNGRFRAEFDVSSGLIVFSEYSSGAWTTITLLTDHTLQRISLVEVGPARAVAIVTVTNDSDGTKTDLRIRIDRGADGALYRVPTGQTLPSALKNDLSGTDLGWSDDPTPEQTLRARSETEDA